MPLDRCSKCGTTPSEGLKNCSGCHGATGAYCSKECQAAHWKIHKPVCRPLEDGEVWGIKILDNRFGPWSRQFEHILLKASYPVFTRGEPCPVTVKCGFPLRIWSEAIHGRLPAMDDNQPAVYLRIEPHNGFAPLHWQMDGPGTCIVVREDRKPLTKEAIEIVYKFHSHLLHLADPAVSERTGHPFGRPLTPEWLRSFADEYREDETSRGRKGFDFFP